MEISKSAAKNDRLNRGLKSELGILGGLTEEGSPLSSQAEIERRDREARDMGNVMLGKYSPDLKAQLEQIRNPFTATRKQ